MAEKIELPATKTVMVESTKREFTIGRPMMRHRKEVAKIIRGLQEVYADMAGSGAEEVIEKFARESGKTVGELSESPLEDLPKELKEELMKLNSESISLEKLAEFQLDIVYICLKKAPFDWDVKTGTAEDLESLIEYAEGFELMRSCVPYIVASIPTAREKKQSLRQSKEESPIQPSTGT